MYLSIFTQALAWDMIKKHDQKRNDVDHSYYEMEY